METDTEPIQLQTESVALLNHLRTAGTPFQVKADGQAPIWEDALWHREVAAASGEEVVLFGTLETIPEGQRARLLFAALEGSRSGMATDERTRLEAATGALLRLLPADAVLTVFLGLRRVRANHKHVTRAMVAYLFNHPEADDLWVRRRAAVRDILEHAVGKATLRACVRYATSAVTPTEDIYLRRHLLRFAEDEDLGRLLLGVLAVSGEAAKATRSTTPAAVPAHQQFADTLYARPERPATIGADDRGEITAALTGIFRKQALPGAAERFAEGLTAVAERCPRYNGRVALVVDVSASLQGYGDREFCVLAQVTAFRMVLARCVTDLAVIPVGAGGMADGIGPASRPSGMTDLATGLLDALATQPGLVLMVSDGYENRYGGDLARIAATLATWETRPAVVFCHAKFTAQDDLTQRQPARGLLPEVGFWHEADFPEVLAEAFLHAPGGPEAVRMFLRNRLG